MHYRSFSTQTYKTRRQALRTKVSSGVILLLGNHEAPMNYTDNTYRFRQDSHFLYYFGIDVAGLAAIIDADSSEEIIFGNELSMDDIVWTGPLPTIQEMAQNAGVTSTFSFDHIESYLQKAKTLHRNIHFLPPYRHDNIIRIAQWLDISLPEVKNSTSLPLIKAVISQRSVKEACEIHEIHKSAHITADMHLAAMHSCKSGMREYEMAAKVHQEALRQGGDLSFATILTINGQTLHNHYQGNVVREGQMILCDAGAENDMHYAGDMTCTFPVGKKFTQKQRDIYEIVLHTHQHAVNMLKPGIAYKEIYIKACEQIFSGLKNLGITKGDPEEAVHAGAHAMFFQCGLGHMMGLDVHDMEDLGEQYVGYSNTIKKGTQFGIKSLRLGKELEAGFVLTVEPGIYFIPALIDWWKSEGRHKDFINYDKLETYRDFSGIRIEEDLFITQNGSTLLGRSLPKTIAEIEELRNQALS